MLRVACGAAFKLVTPGIRPEGTSAHDQARVMTPQAAIAAGADYLVIGRAITAAADPMQALRDINASLGSFAVAIVISAIFVAIIVATTHVRFADVLVAFAPGAMDAMLALALTLHIDPIFVGAHHLSRFVFVTITTPGIIHLFGRPQDDVDD